MTKNRLPAVRITRKQLKRYKELAAQGIYLAEAIRVVAREFNLPRPHTRQGVQERCDREGIFFLAKGNTAKRPSRPVPVVNKPKPPKAIKASKPARAVDSTDGQYVILRGNKRYSLSEIIAALPLDVIIPNLTEQQIREIALRIIQDSLKKPGLEKRLREVEKELTQAKQFNLKYRLVDSNGQVIHGD